jgi:hypothetical protein
MSGAIPLLPQYAFMAWCSVKAQGQLYLYPLCCFSTSVYCSKRILRYRLSPETFGYTLVYPSEECVPEVALLNCCWADLIALSVQCSSRPFPSLLNRYIDIGLSSHTENLKEEMCIFQKEMLAQQTQCQENRISEFMSKRLRAPYSLSTADVMSLVKK